MCYSKCIVYINGNKVREQFMIRKIEKIDNYGIFRKFRWSTDLTEFNKVNLFYGLNGAGKSTLGSIFDNIKNKASGYYDGTFKIIDDEKGEFDSLQLANIDYTMYVFNTHFIEDNIGEYDNLKGIIYISEENKAAKEELDELVKSFTALSREKDFADKEYDKANKIIDSDKTKAAKSIKEQFLVIGGVGSKYSNYNKTYFENAISKYSAFLVETHNLKEILSQIEIEKKSLRDTVKNHISIKPMSINIDEFYKQIEIIKYLVSTELKDCLKKTISDNIFSWLEEGYRLHKDNQKKCLFCGSIITDQRKKELDQIFSEELNILLYKLKNAKEVISSFVLPELNLSESDFYSAQNEKVKNLLRNYKLLRTYINSIIETSITKIDAKIKDPFSIISIEIDNSYNSLKVNTIFDELNKEIEEANKQTESFNQKQTETVAHIEKLLVYYNYYRYDVKNHLQTLKKATKAVKDLESKQIICASRKTSLENELKDVIKAGSEFNKLLSQFLGRDELALEYDEKTKGYKVIRKENGNRAYCLSEGEKTAIAFIYFLTKVKENGNLLKNSIIVFDDPISSFDSNHLYNAYSFIVNYFEESKQLFVLTHNFNFFKLVRKKYQNSASMYLIESKYINVGEKMQRTSQIVNLPKSIKQASSEYSYLFEKIYNFYINYNTTVIADLDMYLYMSNTCRKVLEAFSDFKVQNVSDLYQKLRSLYKCNHGKNYKLTLEETIELEKIYRFVNSLSHKNVFDGNDETDIMFGELYTIVKSILELIEKADKDHYQAMIASIT